MSMVDDLEEEEEQRFLRELKRVIKAARFLSYPHDMEFKSGVRELIADLEKLCE